MTENDQPIVDMLTLRRDLYLVLSLLLADKDVAKMPRMTAWTRDFYGNEVKRLMLWMAVAARSLLDAPGALNKRGEGKERFGQQRCGEYWADFPNGAKGPLEFRQACNSVIHATHILPYKAPLNESTKKVKRVYTDRATVLGVRHGRNTQAFLDVARFVQIADAMINSFEEKSHANR